MVIKTSSSGCQTDSLEEVLLGYFKWSELERSRGGVQEHNDEWLLASHNYYAGACVELLGLRWCFLTSLRWLDRLVEGKCWSEKNRAIPKYTNYIYWCSSTWEFQWLPWFLNLRSFSLYALIFPWCFHTFVWCVKFNHAACVICAKAFVFKVRFSNE